MLNTIYHTLQRQIYINCFEGSNLELLLLQYVFTIEVVHLTLVILLAV